MLDIAIFLGTVILGFIALGIVIYVAFLLFGLAIVLIEWRKQVKWNKRKEKLRREARGFQ